MCSAPKAPDPIKPPPPPPSASCTSFSRITRERGAPAHDDRLDALAMAAAYRIDHMARDNNQAADQLMDAQRDAILKKFVNSVLGRQGARKNWNNNNQGARR
jgi:hypothetical protein